MTMAVIGLENVDRADYGVITVDLDLLSHQYAWLAGMPYCEQREGLLSLLDGISGLAGPPEDEEEEDPAIGTPEAGYHPGSLSDPRD
jgi:hypothetical protein